MSVINIKELVKNSNSKLLIRLPGFVISWITRVVRQEEINRLLEKYSDYSGVAFLPKMLDELKIKVKVRGLDNLPDDGKCFFVSNHPYGIADGLILTSIVARNYGNLKAIGNDVFMLIPQLRPLIAAVSVFGKNDKNYIMELDKVYHSDIPITHFPAGLVSRIEKGKIQDGPWKKSFITKSVECGRNVVPIYFHGRNSLLFYTIFKIRQIIGIKANIELMLLPNEFFNKRNKTITVDIGKPIPYQIFDKTHTHMEWAQWVKKQVYDMELNASEKMRKVSKQKYDSRSALSS